jgi:3-hydroxybutyryl-CoA dehydratase
LTVQTIKIDDTVIAFYGVDKLRFTRPVFIGDTIHVVKKVIGKEPKGADRGVVTFETIVLNQDGQTVIIYTDKLLVKARG